ncbi:hypothetical protein AVEN_235673-1 [Araneus ventricosus]|uniref:Uncharacterized protein n=1 Tax=Araneus ventricosus TaxID=182803 RepID=A0A4Y2BTF5_ARAVE|nr:hypothetical protein AVEN_235673-1 [Araneus ventricosus]
MEKLHEEVHIDRGEDILIDVNTCGLVTSCREKCWRKCPKWKRKPMEVSLLVGWLNLDCFYRRGEKDVPLAGKDVPDCEWEKLHEGVHINGGEKTQLDLITCELPIISQIVNLVTAFIPRYDLKQTKIINNF